MRRTVAVVPAGVGTPGGDPCVVLQRLDSRTVLDWTVRRCRGAAVDEVVVATSGTGADDVVVQHCRAQGYAYVRGASVDVLDRVIGAAAEHRADDVVLVAAGRPFVDPDVVDEVVRVHAAEHRDYTATGLPPPQPATFPAGMLVEAARMRGLVEAWSLGTAPHHRRFVTPYLYEEPGRFSVRVVDGDDPAPEVSWVLRRSADVAALRRLVAAVGADPATPWRTLLDAARARALQTH